MSKLFLEICFIFVVVSTLSAVVLIFIYLLLELTRPKGPLLPGKPTPPPPPPRPPSGCYQPVIDNLQYPPPKESYEQNDGGNMDIEEIRNKKRKMEEEISNLLHVFEKETDICITSVSITPYGIMAAPNDFDVTVKVTV